MEIVSVLDEDCDEPSEIFVQARWQGRELGLPLAQLEGIGVSNQTAEAIADWHYFQVFNSQCFSKLFGHFHSVFLGFTQCCWNLLSLRNRRQILI